MTPRHPLGFSLLIPVLQGIRKRSGLGDRPCAVTVPFPRQASNTPKWAPFFSGKSPRHWTEGTGLGRLLWRRRLPGPLCRGCRGHRQEPCSRALAFLLHQDLPEGTAGSTRRHTRPLPWSQALRPACHSSTKRPFLLFPGPWEAPTVSQLPPLARRPPVLSLELLWAHCWPVTA